MTDGYADLNSDGYIDTAAGDTDSDGTVDAVAYASDDSDTGSSGDVYDVSDGTTWNDTTNTGSVDTADQLTSSSSSTGDIYDIPGDTGAVADMTQSALADAYTIYHSAVEPDSESDADVDAAMERAARTGGTGQSSGWTCPLGRPRGRGHDP